MCPQFYLSHTAFCRLLVEGTLQESLKSPGLERHSSFGDGEVMELRLTPNVFCLALGHVSSVASNMICKSYFTAIY